MNRDRESETRVLDNGNTIGISPRCGLQRDSANKGNISFPVSIDILSWVAYEKKPEARYNCECCPCNTFSLCIFGAGVITSEFGMNERAVVLQFLGVEVRAAVAIVCIVVVFCL